MLDPAVLQALVPTSGVLTPDDPEYANYIEMQEELDWIADGCPPVEGVTISDEERVALLARPLTVRQSARREAVSERTIYRWLKSGELEAHRAGRGWRIPPDALDRRRVEAAKPKPKAAVRKHRPRKRTQTVADGSWWPS